jgi:hypothetical protein
VPSWQRFPGVAPQVGQRTASICFGVISFMVERIGAYLPSSLSGGFLRRDDLLKPDVTSEVILLGAGALVFAILVLILIVVLTQAPALI